MNRIHNAVKPCCTLLSETVGASCTSQRFRIVPKNNTKSLNVESPLLYGMFFCSFLSLFQYLCRANRFYVKTPSGTRKAYLSPSRSQMYAANVSQAANSRSSRCFLLHDSFLKCFPFFCTRSHELTKPTAAIPSVFLFAAVIPRTYIPSLARERRTIMRFWSFTKGVRECSSTTSSRIDFHGLNHGSCTD